MLHIRNALTGSELLTLTTKELEGLEDVSALKELLRSRHGFPVSRSALGIVILCFLLLGLRGSYLPGTLFAYSLYGSYLGLKGSSSY